MWTKSVKYKIMIRWLHKMYTFTAILLMACAYLIFSHSITYVMYACSTSACQKNWMNTPCVAHVLMYNQFTVCIWDKHRHTRIFMCMCTCWHDYITYLHACIVNICYVFLCMYVFVCKFPHTCSCGPQVHWHHIEFHSTTRWRQSIAIPVVTTIVIRQNITQRHQAEYHFASSEFHLVNF